MIVGSVFLILGLALYGLGVLGLIRLPEAFSRLHATTKCDTLGIGFVFLGVALMQGFSASLWHLLLIVLFMWLTNPTAAHALAKMAYQQTKEDDHDLA